MDSTALASALAGFGVLLIAISYQRHRVGRDLSALVHGGSGALLFLGGALLFAVALNFNTYAPLRPGEPLAELSIEKSSANNFQARLLRIPAGDLQVFTLQGERWDMQARLLQWQGWTARLGLSNNIRLEQLNSLSVGRNNSNAPSTYANSYSLSRNPGINLWAWQQQYPERFTALRTRALQTATLPLQNGLRFHLYLVDGALVARQINTPGATARSTAVASVALPDFINELNRQTQNSSTAADAPDERDDAAEPATPIAVQSTSSSSAVLD
jgi:hypothetical protein